MAARRFTVPAGTTADDVAAGLARSLPVVPDRRWTSRRTFYDTFDWRVHRAGGIVEVVAGGEGARFVWRSPGGPDIAVAPAPAELRLAGDLPEGPARDGLGPVVGVRALLPVARVRTTTTVYRVLDDDEKTVARVAVERDVAGAADLGHRVSVVPLRGYDREAERVAGALTADLGLTAAEGDVLDLALAAAGRRPGDYSPKVRVALDRATPSIDAAGTVLSALLAVVEANEDGARRDVDPEFLHDLRVAVRRTRTAVQAFAEALPDGVAATAGDGFRWAQQVTGPARDLDVLVSDLVVAATRLPADMADDLAPAVAHLTARREAAQRELARTLRSPRWQELIGWWRGVVADPRAAGPAGPGAGVPVGAVAADRVRRADRRVRRIGRSIDQGTPAEVLHDLRKRSKELRYLLELLGSALPGGDPAPVVAELKALQENLGTFQDCQVQEAAVRALAGDLVASRAVPAGTVLAMGALVDDLRRRAATARAGFADRFAAFDRPAARRRVERLLAAA